MMLQASVLLHIMLRMYIIFYYNIMLLQHWLASHPWSTLQKGVSRNDNVF